MNNRNDLDASSSVAAHKAAAAKSLGDADHSVVIHSTEFFNNTYAPDLVLTWPSEARERHVFLRTSSNPAWLLEDVLNLDDEKSILMPLTPLVETDGRDEHAELNIVARNENVLVATPSSFSVFAHEDKSAVASLASHSLMRGGSGYVDRVAAESLSDDLEYGFLGAQEGDADLTRTGLETSAKYLTEESAAEITELFQAVWLGAGEGISSFPGEIQGSPSMTPALLATLLDAVDIDNASFWDRIGRQLRLPILSGLTYTEDNRNFQRLMAAAAPLLRVKGGRLFPRDRAVTGVQWFVRNGAVGLAVSQHELFLSSSTVAALPEGAPEIRVSTRQLANRARSANVSITDVTLGSEERRVEYSAANGASVVDDVQLRDLDASLGETSHALNASVKVGSSKLRINFHTSTASGNTAAMFFVSDIVLKGLPLLAPLSTDTVATLERAFLVE